ncbi:hypothetical protein VAEU17_4280171 [Vibrio aestuarianus]|nr:hypothetical protein VAEU17_4280171 [Vibrio aestuarianus]
MQYGERYADAVDLVVELCQTEIVTNGCAFPDQKQRHDHGLLAMTIKWKVNKNRCCRYS